MRIRFIIFPITKEKSTGRVDGIVAACMAAGRAMTSGTAEKSFWETLNADTRSSAPVA